METEDRNWEFILKVDKKLDTVIETLAKAREEIAGLRVKASMWGGVAGIIASLPALIWIFLKFGDKLNN